MKKIGFTFLFLFSFGLFGAWNAPSDGARACFISKPKGDKGRNLASRTKEEEDCIGLDQDNRDATGDYLILRNPEEEKGDHGGSSSHSR